MVKRANGHRMPLIKHFGIGILEYSNRKFNVREEFAWSRKIHRPFETKFIFLHILNYTNILISSFGVNVFLRDQTEEIYKY